MNLAGKFNFSTHANQIKRNIKWASYDQWGKKGKYVLDLQMRKLMRMEIFASFRNEIILEKKKSFHCLRERVLDGAYVHSKDGPEESPMISVWRRNLFDAPASPKPKK